MAASLARSPTWRGRHRRTFFGWQWGKVMRRFFSDYGMLVVLLVLCAGLSAATLAEQVGGGATAGEELGQEALRQFGAGAQVVIITGEGNEDRPCADEAARVVSAGSATVVARVQGPPRTARLALEKMA